LISMKSFLGVASSRHSDLERRIIANRFRPESVPSAKHRGRETPGRDNAARKDRFGEYLTVDSHPARAKVRRQPALHAYFRESRPRVDCCRPVGSISKTSLSAP
jgi:hypothetical protein